MTNRDEAFYPTLGPFLGRREVHRELGGPIYDEDERTWYVALERGRVAGFCSAKATSAGAVYQSAYVRPEHRKRDVYQQLWAARDAEWPGPARATVTPASQQVFLDHGFHVHATKGRFVVVRRD